MESGGVVSHGVGRPMDVGGLLTVSVVPLMEAGGATEVGPRRVGSDSSLMSARYGRGVIGEGTQGSLANIKILGGNVGPGHQRRMLQVAISEVALGVVGRNHPVLDVLRERELPEYRVIAFAEEDPVHTYLGGVHCLDGGRVLRYYFGDPGGALAQALDKPFEVIEVRSDVLGDLDASIPGFLEA